MKCLKLIYIVVAVFSVTAVSCRDAGVKQRLDDAETIMAEHPDSALAILNGIDVSALDGKEQKAHYALLKSMALDKNYIDTTSFDVLQPAIDYYLKKGSADEKLRTCYYQGRIYQNKGDNDSAMQMFMRGREFCQEASDTLMMANLMVAQATIQYAIYKFDDFIRNNLDAAALYHAIDRKEYEMLSLTNALDGSILQKDKRLSDSIMSVARERVCENEEFASYITPYILEYTMRFGDKKQVAEVLGNYSPSLSLSDFDKIHIADAYCEIGDIYNARRIWDSIDSTSYATSSMEYLAVKSEILEQCGDLVKAMDAYRDFYSTLDSIHRNIFSHDLLFAQERHEMEKAHLMTLQKRDRIIWLSIIAVCLSALISVLIYFRYRLNRSKRIIAELKVDGLKHEIAALAAEQERLKEVLAERNDLVPQIQDVLKNRLEMLNSLLAKEISGDDRYARPYNKWIETIKHDKTEFIRQTREAVTATHPAFMEELKSHGLTDDELGYVCLLVLGLRGKDVGEYIQLKRHYHVSSEIRKKLGIDEHVTNLGNYIRRLMSDKQRRV